MPPRELISRFAVENLLWFLACLALAFFVWMIANAQSDPIQERSFSAINIQIEPAAGLQITNNPTRTVRVRLRGQKSALDALSSDEITVRAVLTGLGAGTHVVELQAEVAPARRAQVIDIQPTQIRVTLENIEARKIPVVAVVTGEPQVEFERDEPVFDLNQVEVSGVASKISQVVAAQVSLDLTQQRNPFQQEMRLVPVDTDGVAVEEVTVDPQTVQVQVSIRQRGDVRQVPVRPNILFDTLPQGYFLSSLSYAPQTITLSGDLGIIPGTLFTAPIDLTDRTSSFEITVPVELPEGNLLVLDGQNITVSVGITAPTSNRQFVNVPVETIGLGDGYSVQLAPETVTVLVTGPQPVLEALQAEDIDVVVDLNGLGEGNHEIVPTVTVREADVASSSISVLPTSVNVEIVRESRLTPQPLPET